MSQTCEGPAPARTGPAENAPTKKLLESKCRAGTDGSAAMDEAAARRLTMRIQLQLDALANNVEQIILLIEQAKAGGVHRHLGYVSWTAYVREEFAGRLDRLRQAERRPIVEILADTGMSTRAIAPIVGVSHMTVARDLEQVSHGVTPADVDLPEDELDEILPIVDTTEEEFEAAVVSAGADKDPSRENVLRRLPGREVTGTDGKTYSVPAPVPPKPRRKPLTDAYWSAIYDLEKVVKKIQRMHADDRFVGLRAQLQERHQGVVERLTEALLQIEDELRDDVR